MVFKREASETVGVSGLTQATPVPATVHVITFPECNRRIRDWSATQRVCEEDECLTRSRFEHEGRIGNENHFACGKCTARRLQQVSTDRKLSLNPHLFTDAFMRGTIAEVPGPRLDGWTASDRNSLYPRPRIGFTFFCIFGLDETHVLSHIKLVDVEINATNVAGIQSKLNFRIG